MFYLSKRAIQKISLCSLVCMFFLTSHSMAAAKPILAKKIPDQNNGLVIDGSVDEDVWFSAQEISDFHQIKPIAYSSPSEKTEVRVLYDSENIYISAILYDRDIEKINHAQYIKGRPFHYDDQFHITIDSFENKRSGYFFQINPNGGRYDALITNASFNDNWSTIWDVKCSIKKDSWQVEFVLPLKSISFDPNKANWGINFGRSIPRRKEVLAWSSRGQDTWEMIPSVAGTLSDIKLQTQSGGLDVVASGVAFKTKDTYKNNGIESYVKDESFEPSLDVFYKPAPDTTFTATLNPDFSITELDDAVLNLTRFSVLIPEKREFFLQDGNIFNFGGIQDNGTPFVSRKIGLDALGSQIDINGGLKFVTRKEGFSLGVLTVNQDSTKDGTSTLSVLRGTADVLKESSVGFIYTEGNPNEDFSSRTLGTDFSYRNSHFMDAGAISSNFWYQQNDTSLPLNVGRAYGGDIGYNINNYSIGLSSYTIGEHFNPALGFVNRGAVKSSAFKLEKSFWVKSAYFSLYKPALKYEVNSSILTPENDKALSLTPLYFENQFGDNISYTKKFFSERVDYAYTLLQDLVIAPEGYDFSYDKIELQSSESRTFHIGFSYQTGDFYAGKNDTTVWKMSLRPFDKVLVGGELYLSKLNFDKNYDIKIRRITSEIALTENIAWYNFYQTDSLTNQVSFQSKLHWQPSLGSDIYLAYINGKIYDEELILNKNLILDERKSFITKISWNFRF